jgi:hypothetical protein
MNLANSIQYPTYSVIIEAKANQHPFPIPQNLFPLFINHS